MLYRSGRNTSDWDSEVLMAQGRGLTAAFELVSPVYKDSSAKRAAAIANLVKANASRRKRSSERASSTG